MQAFRINCLKAAMIYQYSGFLPRASQKPRTSAISERDLDAN
jgi:hypothetical protein